MNKEDYDKYINSAYWEEHRKKRLAEDSHTCQMCGAKNNLTVHHISYQELNECGKDTGTSHLITLCKRCHRDVHEFYDELKKFERMGHYMTDGLRNRDWTYEENVVYEQRNELLRGEGFWLEKEENLKCMTYVLDVFAFSRCSDLTEGGDIPLINAGKKAEKSFTLGNYINGLFSLNPYVDVAEYWREKTLTTHPGVKRYRLISGAIRMRQDEAYRKKKLYQKTGSTGGSKKPFLACE